MRNREIMDTKGVRAIVEHEYQAKEPDELNLIKGAILYNIKIQPGGWWEGTIQSSGLTGMFPDNFVRVLDTDDKNPVVLRDKSATQNRRCKAVYSYTQNNNDELTLAVGDIIEFLGEVEEGWWKGKLGGKIGVFPSNFVVTVENVSPILANRRSTGVGKASTEVHLIKFKTDINSSREDIVAAVANIGTSVLLEKDAPILPPKPVRELCKVLFPYPPSNEDELELKEGDIISVISKELPDKGWWKGELKGKIGVFPDNFVISMSPEASPSKDAIASNNKPNRPSASSKIVTTNRSSNRKDSFGSRDSLNDTGIPTGNVAAYRKSLENKVMDLSLVEKTNRKSIDMKSSDVRKSMENLDDKKTTPPVLTKKPIVPIKKSPTVGSVAGGLFSGIKSKTKNDGKLSSNDSLDGIGSSKSIGGHVADNSDKGVVGERLKRDNIEFDQVERGTILQDMRAGRAKGPSKRRPPTSSSNSFGEGTGDATYQNGGNGHVELEHKSESLDDDVAKPKPRNWEKQKAPWMDELKASQAKKTSPNVENRSPDSSSKSTELETNEKFDMSKSFSSSFVSSHKKLSDINNFEIRSNSVDVKSQHSVDLHNKKDADNPMASNPMAKSMTTKTSESTTSADTFKIRPTSVNLRNRSISPVARFTKSIHAQSTSESTKLINNDTIAQPISNDNVCARVAELEQKVVKLEKLVLHQSQTIDELLKSIKVESDKVKVLKGELDKYAQCVTQV